MRTLIRITVAALIAALAIPLHAGPSYAGGLTSVLVTSADKERATAAYATRPSYARLAAAVGLNQPLPPKSEPRHPRRMVVWPSGPQITLTWTNHDVGVQRIDQVLLDVEGGPWIRTVIARGDQDVYCTKGIWHRPTEPGRLRGVLTKLGVADARPPGEPTKLPPNRPGDDVDRNDYNGCAHPSPSPQPSATGTQRSNGGTAAHLTPSQNPNTTMAARTSSAGVDGPRPAVLWGLSALLIGLVAGALGRPAFITLRNRRARSR